MGGSDDFNRMMARMIRGPSFLERLFGPSLRRTLAELRSADEERREAALDRLRGLSRGGLLRPRSLSHIYAAIRCAYHDDGSTRSLCTTREVLLRALWRTHNRGTISFIRDVLLALPPNPAFRLTALRVLSEMATPESMIALRDLLMSHGRTLGAQLYSVFVPLRDAPPEAALLFPELLQLLEHPESRSSIYGLTQALLDANQLDQSQTLRAAKPHLLADAAAASPERKPPVDPDEGDPAGYRLELAAALLGQLPGDPDVPLALLKMMDDASPSVRVASLVALLRLGQAVPEELLLALAASPATRIDLARTLDGAGQLDCFPNAYWTQQQMAEAIMVDWLKYPTELGHAPAAIELLDERVGETGTGPGRLYLWKFRGKSNDSPWYVGLSGPQPVEPGQVALYGSMTFSSFKAVEEMTPGEHFEYFINR